MKDKEIVQKTSQIFSNLFPSNFYNPLAEGIDEEIYFHFGEALLSVELLENDKTIIHDYLDLFRLTGFLKRVYGEKQWEKLTLDLIVKSNFKVDTLFNQRVEDYGNKPLFKIIENGKIREYKWTEIKNIVDQYSKSLSSVLKEKKNKFAAFLIRTELGGVLIMKSKEDRI